MADELQPVAARWTGEAFEPLRGFVRASNKQFVVGEVYTVQAELPRNMAAHRGFFARIREAWQTLPEGMQELYPSAEHLRHAALIATGYCMTQDTACASKAEADRFAAFAMHAARTAGQYWRVAVVQTVVRIKMPESQSVRAMGRERFRASCEAVEGWIAETLGVSLVDLRSVAA